MVKNYWDTRYLAGGFEWGAEPTVVATLAAELMPDQDLRTVLDVGCGYGRDCIYLAEKGFDVSGIDSAQAGVRMAEDWAKEKGLTIRFQAMDMTGMDFEEGSFDAVIMFNTMHFVKEAYRKKAYKEVRRVLKPGGLFVQAVFSLEERGFKEGVEVEKNTFEFKPGRPVHFFSEEELRSDLSGFAIAKLERQDVFEKHQNGDQHYHKEWIAVANKL